MKYLLLLWGLLHLLGKSVIEVFECNLLQFNLLRRRVRRVIIMAPRHFPEQTLLDDFTEAEALRSWRWSAWCMQSLLAVACLVDVLCRACMRRACLWTLIMSSTRSTIFGFSSCAFCLSIRPYVTAEITLDTGMCDKLPHEKMSLTLSELTPMYSMFIHLIQQGMRLFCRLWALAKHKSSPSSTVDHIEYILSRFKHVCFFDWLQNISISTFLLLC